MIDIEKLKEITIKAGKIAMKYYNKNYDIYIKEDESPVTEADFAINDFITSSLQKLYPNIAILSEENNHEDNLKAAKEKEIFIIDPIDGTKAFVSKESQFTINIGYILDGKFTLGFIHVPILDILYYSDYQNSYKLEKDQLEILKKENNNLKDGLIQVSSLNKMENQKIATDCQDLKITKIINLSSSYKLCLIAEGRGNFYPRRGPMKIWDVAAAFGILKFLDYQFLDLKGREITFERMIEDFSLPYFNLFRSKEIFNYIEQ
jgi:3'(2'), 5'-bisphosphate nucleotidase